MRDDLTEIYRDATGAEYVFGDSITAISPSGEVRFEKSAPRRYDLVIGADGLHSNVRRLTFGDRAATYIGASFAVFTLPNLHDLDGELRLHAGAGRTAGMYAASRHGPARALLLFRSPHDFPYDGNDHTRILRDVFTGLHAELDRWLGELDCTPALYFDSIAQIRLDTWSRGHVTLVGDAGYSPGPAVGGSTTLAIFGAYVLAHELARFAGDPGRAFPAYASAPSPWPPGCSPPCRRLPGAPSCA